METLALDQRVHGLSLGHVTKSRSHGQGLEAQTPLFADGDPDSSRPGDRFGVCA